MRPLAGTPAYRAQDDTQITTFDPLRRVAEVTEVEQSITAAPPGETLAAGRRMGRHDQPAGRFEVAGRFSQHLIPTACG